MTSITPKLVSLLASGTHVARKRHEPRTIVSPRPSIQARPFC